MYESHQNKVNIQYNRVSRWPFPGVLEYLSTVCWYAVVYSHLLLKDMSVWVCTSYRSSPSAYSTFSTVSHLQGDVYPHLLWYDRISMRFLHPLFDHCVCLHAKCATDRTTKVHTSCCCCCCCCVLTLYHMIDNCTKVLATPATSEMWPCL